MNEHSNMASHETTSQMNHNMEGGACGKRAIEFTCFRLEIQYRFDKEKSNVANIVHTRYPSRGKDKNRTDLKAMKLRTESVFTIVATAEKAFWPAFCTQ